MSQEHSPATRGSFADWWPESGLANACLAGVAERIWDAARAFTPSATRRIPEFIDVGAEYEICRFSNGEWSLRLKQGDDRAHVRYLNKHEKGFVDAALAAMGATDGTAKSDG